VVVNIGEDQLDEADAIAKPVRDAFASGEGGGAGEDRAEVLTMCVQLEAEAALMPADERAEMLEGLGLGEGRWRASSARRSTCSAGARTSRRGRRRAGPGCSGPAPRPPSAPG
jgi:hypothetical protein